MQEDVKKLLAAKIRSLREAEGISQEKLAEICDVSWRTVSNLECGKSIPDLRFVLALANHFHTSLDNMLDVSVGQAKSYVRLCKENHLLAKVESLSDKNLELAVKIIDVL